MSAPRSLTLSTRSIAPSTFWLGVAVPVALEVSDDGWCCQLLRCPSWVRALGWKSAMALVRGSQT